jgi:hypothetical protein
LNRILATAGLVALLLAALAAPAHATTVTEKNLTDLCKEADMVFVGRVVSVESRWHDAPHKSIETVVRFAVTQPLYGVHDSDVTLTFSGGEVEGLRQVIAGMPQFQPGEDVLLFASNKPSMSPIIGFHQGCFRVVDGDNGAVVLNADGLPVTADGRALVNQKRENGAPGGATLDELLGKVREQLDQRGKESP